MKLSEFLELWMDAYIRPIRAPKTADAYRYALAHLSPAILASELDELTPIRLQKEVNALAADYSRQAQLLFVALKASLRKAEQLGMMHTRPMELVEKPRHEKAEICYFTPQEAVAYLREAQKQSAGALLVLMLCVGLRRNEARALRFGDLMPDGILKIRRQRVRDALQPLKSKASRREIPIPGALWPLFDGPQGEYLANISENGLRRQHLAAMRAAGIEKPVTLHGLRHSCASAAVADGAQLATVQKLLGHAKYNVTAEFYVHIDRALMARCTDVIIGAFDYHHTEECARLEIV